MEIKIGKSGKQCHFTGTSFAHGDEIVSVLRIQGGELVREDYSRQSWDDSYGTAAMAVWSNRYIDPAVAEQEPPEKFSPIRHIFYEAAVSEDRNELAVAYLAAQLLRRQKVFRLIKEAEEAEGIGRVALFSDRIGDKLIEVRDPNLTYAEMEDGRIALMERLTRLESPEEPAEEPAAVVEP
jgi:hypothetical protein